MRFPYQEELLSGPAPPSLPVGATTRWRPLIPVQVVGPGGVSRHYPRALACLGWHRFHAGHGSPHWSTAGPETGHRVRWRGQLQPLRFGDIELVLNDGVSTWRWGAVVGFSPAPLRYPILGNAGCLQYIDALFRGVDLLVELSTNGSFAGRIT